MIVAFDMLVICNGVDATFATFVVIDMWSQAAPVTGVEIKYVVTFAREAVPRQSTCIYNRNFYITKFPNLKQVSCPIAGSLLPHTIYESRPAAQSDTCKLNILISPTRIIRAFLDLRF